MAADPPNTRLDRAWPWIIRCTGLALLAYETIFEHTDRPTLLLVAAAMIGLPEFVKIDRNRRNGNGSKSS